jgi:predicted small lipoprotein YifL
MKLAIRATVLAAFALSLAACAAQQPAADLTPPPAKPYDAKTQLESGRKR